MSAASIALQMAAAVLVLSAAVLATEDIVRGSMITHHSLHPPYIADWWQEGIPHWEMGGDAVATDSFVRLTPQKQSRYGWIWNQQPNENPNWELRMKFAVFGKRAPGADGLALWYVAESYRQHGGNLFGNKPDFKGIGLLFDTYDNDGLRDNPSVSLVVNLDGSKTNWDHDRDFLGDATFRCNFDFRHSTVEDPVEAVLQYYNKRLTLKLRMARRGVDVNCGDTLLELPIGHYFGATASTGGMVDNHDIISIEVRGLGEDAVDHSTAVEHFDSDADQRDRGFWGPQERKNPRQR